jgi:hypothetical protein
VIRLALVALAAAGAVWLSDELVRVWSSDAFAERRREVESWLWDRSVAPEGTSAPTTELPRETVQVAPPDELAPVEAAQAADAATGSTPPEPAAPLPVSIGGAPEPAGGALEPKRASAEPEVPPAERLSRTQAERVRFRLGRVMDLAAGSGR